MTYYGRWTYKMRSPLRKGRRRRSWCTKRARPGHPFEVVRGSWSRENFDIAQPQSGQTPSRVAVEGWITLEKAKGLFQAAGRDFDAKKHAATRQPRFPAGTALEAVRFEVTNTLRELKSRNVIAKIEGTDSA